MTGAKETQGDVNTAVSDHVKSQDQAREHAEEPAREPSPEPAQEHAGDQTCPDALDALLHPEEQKPEGEKDCRFAYVKNNKKLVHALKWLKPGSVWAMDFTKFPSPLEGGMKLGLAVRDMSSRCCLELLVTDAEDSKTVIDLLKFLFSMFGIPLVIKSDNGPPFASHEMKTFLEESGVFLLLSPPYTPSYNGAIESGFYPIKNFALLEAARNDRPTAWTMPARAERSEAGGDDVFAAKCRFNSVVRPDDPLDRTPEQIFDGRFGVTDQTRERFRECYLEHRKDAQIELGFLLDYEDLSIQEQARIDRIAIIKALLEQDYLQFRRRRITPGFSRRKCAGIVGG